MVLKIVIQVLCAFAVFKVSNSRRYDPGPTVDPGVFVITHIQSCRNGAGYCILGFSCDVDKDFIPDDLGGDCEGLGAAFNPVTTFVCCRENPETAAANNVGKDDTDGDVVEAHTSTTTTTPTTTTVPATTSLKTEFVTEIVTETETEIIPIVESVTEITFETSIEPLLTKGPEARLEIETVNQLRPGFVFNDDTPLTGFPIEEELELQNPENNCFAAILLGLNCTKTTTTTTTDSNGGWETSNIKIVPEESSSGTVPNLETRSTSTPLPKPDPTPEETITTTKTGLEPDRDELAAKPMTVSSTASMPLPSNTVKASVQVRNGDIVVSGDFVEDDIVPLRFQDGAQDDIFVKLEDTATVSPVVVTGPSPSTKKYRKEDVEEERSTSATGNKDSNIKTITPDTASKSELVNLNLESFDASAEELVEPRSEATPDEVENDQEEDDLFFQGNCGRLGGSAVLQAFGRAAHNLLPDLVASWVTGHVGHAGGLRKSSRLNDEELEPRIIAGDVTSTVLYCWMAAIVEYLPGDKKKFLCTGTLVKQDLIVTSASCTHRLFERGVQHFKVILGDSNLNIDLPFGVQSHDISQVIIHENYKPEETFHFDDIGLIKLKTLAKLENTICLLCLPQRPQSHLSENCTVVGYGRTTDSNQNILQADESDDDTTDGILRKADLPIIDSDVCQQFLSDSDAGIENFSNGFLCAGGTGEEESCFVAMDGGSPLSCETNGRFELSGLVTFGTSCPHDKSPSLFTDVAKFSTWIKDNYLKMKRRR